MKQVMTSEPIGYARHAHSAGNRDQKHSVAVYGINYFDDTRYSRGKLKPNMRAVPANLSDADIRAIAAAITKRARKGRNPCLDVLSASV